jgi:hydroxymethylbilane synthase
VASLLVGAHPGLEVELVPLSTAGDRTTDLPIWEMGGRGVFVGELQAAVLAGEADAAVHSAKDLQPKEPPGLCLAATPQRADPRDALVGARLTDLGPGAVVATGSQRRRAQLAAARPGLEFTSLRGNIATRLQRVPPGGAVVVALAALERLDLQPEPMEVLSTDVMLPQVAQGAIAVECRAGDADIEELLRCVDHAETRTAVEAERSFLATLGGGCDLPVAANATIAREGSERPIEHGDGCDLPVAANAPWLSPTGTGQKGGGRAGEPNEAWLVLTGLVAAPDGSRLVRRQATGPAADPTGLGQMVAEAVLGGGGRELMSGTF